MDVGKKGITTNFLEIISILESPDEKHSNRASEDENKHILTTLIGTIIFLVLNAFSSSNVAKLLFAFGVLLCSIPILKVSLGWIKEAWEHRKAHKGESTLVVRAKFQTPIIENYVEKLVKIDIEELEAFKDWLTQTIKYDTAIIAIFATIAALLPKAAEILSVGIAGLAKINSELEAISSGLGAGANIAMIILVVTTLVVKTSLPTYARYLFYINFTINHGYDRKA